MNRIFRQNNSGYIALLAVLVLLAVGTSIGVIVSLNSLAELNNAFGYYSGQKAFALADACAQEAIFQLKNQGASYSGTTLSFASDYCTITISSSAGSATAQITSLVADQYTKKIKLTADLSPFLLTSWEEVSSF